MRDLANALVLTREARTSCAEMHAKLTAWVFEVLGTEGEQEPTL